MTTQKFRNWLILFAFTFAGAFGAGYLGKSLGRQNPSLCDPDSAAGLSPSVDCYVSVAYNRYPFFIGGILVGTAIGLTVVRRLERVR